MADIFISYSKVDRAIVELLAADLEREGWTVWFDRSLLAGDEYRDEIVKQLDLARAVIVVWTAASVKSDWVRSEAARAKRVGKLIPVSVPPIRSGDIPLPFGEINAEPIAAFARIKAAVEAQLLKPAVTPGALWLATRELRYQALTWLGIIGGAITVFAGLSTLLKLADWARVLVTHWQAWTQGFWAFVFGWVGWQVPKPWVPVLTGSLSILLISVGQRLIAGTGRASLDWRSAIAIASFPLIVLLGVFVVLAISPIKVGDIAREHKAEWMIIWTSIPLPFLTQYLFFAFRARRDGALAVIVGQHVILSSIVLNPILSLMNGPAIQVAAEALIAGIVLAWGLPSLTMLIAPIRPLARRVWTTLAGLALLLALNELSKLGLDLAAPRALLR